MLVPLPSLPEQRAIAEVLRALDDKIEANRNARMRARTSAMTVFTSMQLRWPESTTVGALAKSISRGVAPR